MGLGLEFGEVAEGFGESVMGFFGVALNGGVARVGVEQGVVVGGAVEGVEFDGCLAAAFEVPTAFEDAFEEDLLEGAVGDEVVAEAGFELGEGLLHGGETDEATGGEAVGEVVAGGGGFACVGARSGGELGVCAVGGDLFFGGHFEFPFRVYQLKKRPAGLGSAGALSAISIVPWACQARGGLM